LIAISVVSHGQGALVLQLLQDIREHCVSTRLHVLLTLNIDEDIPFEVANFPFEIRIIRNRVRRGFAENHNAAFAISREEYFCVVNPDIRLNGDPFPALVSGLSDISTGVAGPLVIGSLGRIEDSARRFPTLLSIARKVFSRKRALDYDVEHTPFYPDWIGGMFMLWRADVFRKIGGFDEGFFLYYEDVDVCARLRHSGFRVVFIPAARVTHNARRSSHRSLRYFRWHLTSMFRYFWKQVVARRNVRLKC
jgi:N-acetylglucosaminyl-diphospho-decaprenol L-rhamnosyltransferase